MPTYAAISTHIKARCLKGELLLQSQYRNKNFTFRKRFEPRNWKWPCIWCSWRIFYLAEMYNVRQVAFLRISCCTPIVLFRRFIASLFFPSVNCHYKRIQQRQLNSRRIGKFYHCLTNSYELGDPKYCSNYDLSVEEVEFHSD